MNKVSIMSIKILLTFLQFQFFPKKNLVFYHIMSLIGEPETMSFLNLMVYSGICYCTSVGKLGNYYGQVDKRGCNRKATPRELRASGYSN